MSRLARNCRDWHQLLELCAVFGALLGDADGIYNPRDHNDRLLLGLKGSLNEYELDLLRQRSLEARYEKLKLRIAEQHATVPTKPDIDIEDFTALSSDLEAIWDHEGSSERLKKRILRSLIDEIIVDIDEPAGKINLVIHWQGGVHTELCVPRRTRSCVCHVANVVKRPVLQPILSKQCEYSLAFATILK